jgi:CRP/FNR family transcriptional regulator, cyclic AMP receptor protein
VAGDFGPAERALPTRLSPHARCVVLSSFFRGSMCEQLASGPARHLAAGQRLYHIGGDARSVFVVRRGLVRTSLVSSRGQELTLRLHAAGDVVGELCLCTGERREQATAIAASEVVEIPIDQLTARLRQDPQAALDFTASLGRRLADAEERLRSLAMDPVLERLVRALLTLATEFGERTTAGVRIRHRLAQDELARLVGARREVVSGLMNRLRDKGLISYARAGFIVVDHRRLIELRDWLEDDVEKGESLLAR